MRAINLSVLTLVVLAAPALSATCYRPNAAGGEIPYECVRGEELKVDAPSLEESKIPSMDQRELDAIEKLIDGATEAIEPAVPAER